MVGVRYEHVSSLARGPAHARVRLRDGPLLLLARGPSEPPTLTNQSGDPRSLGYGRVVDHGDTTLARDQLRACSAYWLLGRYLFMRGVLR